MTNSKATKKALFMSVISLMLCFTMLMGATFAWFTDTVKSSNNRIVAGNLDVDLVMYKETEGKYVSIANGSGDIFSEATGNGINWEPGKTEIVYLGVQNKGSLALKYNIILDIIDGEIPLSGSLEYALIDGAEYEANKYADWTAVKTAAGEQVAPMQTGTGLVAAENGVLDEIMRSGEKYETDYFALAVHMKEEAGNEYQNGSITIDLTVLATQVEAELDSFDDTYDKNADFDGQISTVDALNAAIANGGDYQVMSDLALEETMTVSEGTTLALNLSDNTLTGNIEVASGASLTVENGAIENTDSEVSGIQTNGGDLTLNDVEITSARHGVRVEGGEVVINSGTYKVVPAEGSSLTQHALNVSDGGNVIINGGTFIGAKGTSADSGAAVNVQAGSTVTINGGDFSNGKNWTLYGEGTIIVKGGTFDQDPSTYVADGYVATKNTDGTWTVVEGLLVNDQQGLADAIAEGEESVYLSAGNFTMPEPDLRGKTLTISGTKDTVIDVSAVDARDQFVTGATLEFDGVTLNFGTVNYMGFANTESLTYKNCQINGLQFLYGDNVTFEDCDFNSNGAEHSVWTYGAKNVSFTGCDFTYGDRGINCYSDNDVDGGKQTVNFTNCTFTTDNTASEGAVEINSCFFSVGIEANLTGCTAPAYGELAYVSPWDSTNGAKTTININ